MEEDNIPVIEFQLVKNSSGSSGVVEVEVPISKSVKYDTAPPSSKLHLISGSRAGASVFLVTALGLFLFYRRRRARARAREQLRQEHDISMLPPDIFHLVFRGKDSGRSTVKQAKQLQSQSDSGDRDTVEGIEDEVRIIQVLLEMERLKRLPSSEPRDQLSCRHML
ncbi:hypothetical protein BDP27DRAFT_1315944 [Rhodocollybia butyracea]|uniref:Uncharacterized protein n=1 Tax=Rhodocollybia butyracea TaxID=206335 RepID=A0A9P5UDP1_9AGAR|nr:hypothetical protein BDP27DRAFT_1315944 [Rhodocollybia butyracea]